MLIVIRWAPEWEGAEASRRPRSIPCCLARPRPGGYFQQAGFVCKPPAEAPSAPRHPTSTHSILMLPAFHTPVTGVAEARLASTAGSAAASRARMEPMPFWASLRRVGTPSAVAGHVALRVTLHVTSATQQSAPRQMSQRFTHTGPQSAVPDMRLLPACQCVPGLGA